jgi:hypothetical protein
MKFAIILMTWLTLGFMVGYLFGGFVKAGQGAEREQGERNTLQPVPDRNRPSEAKQSA